MHGEFADFDRRVPELRASKPDVVLDMRAFRREEGRRVLAFAGVAARAVLASSAGVYLAYGRLHRTEPGEPVPVPLTEESPLRTVVIREDYDKVGVEAVDSSRIRQELGYAEIVAEDEALRRTIAWERSD